MEPSVVTAHPSRRRFQRLLRMRWEGVALSPKKINIFGLILRDREAIVSKDGPRIPVPSRLTHEVRP